MSIEHGSGNKKPLPVWKIRVFKSCLIRRFKKYHLSAFPNAEFSGGQGSAMFFIADAPRLFVATPG